MYVCVYALIATPLLSGRVTHTHTHEKAYPQIKR